MNLNIFFQSQEIMIIFMLWFYIYVVIFKIDCRNLISLFMCIKGYMLLPTFMPIKLFFIALV